MRLFRGIRSVSALTALAAVVSALMGPTAVVSAASTFQVTVPVTANGVTRTQALRYSLPGSAAVTMKWTPGDTSAKTWLTTATSDALTQKLALSTVTLGSPQASTTTVAVDPGTPDQVMDGFGGAMTDSSAWLIWNADGATVANDPNADHPKRDAIMNDLFASSGARLTFARLALGASDFVRPDANTLAPFQSYDDTPPDLRDFSIGHDANIIELIEQARALSPAMTIVAAPWSAPGWMKVGYQKMWGDCRDEAGKTGAGGYPAANYGHLASGRQRDFATYLAKAVEAYRAAGVAIDILGLQNEPQACKWNQPSMRMTSAEQAVIAPLVRTALDDPSRNLQSVKLLAWDHNYDMKNPDPTKDTTVPATYPQDAMGWKSTGTTCPGNSLDAAGFHAYGGADSIGRDVQDAFLKACPGKSIYVTEITSIQANSNLASNLVWRSKYSLIYPLQHMAKGSLYWNLALDTNYGPRADGICPTNCRPMMTVKSDGTYDLTEEYYAYAHFSKLVDPGATRISATEPSVSGNAVRTVAFRNLDGSIVVVALNQAPPA